MRSAAKRRRTAKGPKYDDEAAARVKLECNRFVLDTLLAREARERSGVFLVLDAESLRTSRALVRRGACLPRDILACNMADLEPFARGDEELRGLRTTQRYTGQLLARALEARSVAFAFLDYTCSLQGSKRCRPQRELAAGFRRRVFKPGAVLALTLHVRRDTSEEEAEAQARRFLSRAMLEGGYEPEHLATRHYQNLESRLMILVFSL